MKIEFVLLQDDFWLVVEPTHLKNISQMGSFPEVGLEISCFVISGWTCLGLQTPNYQEKVSQKKQWLSLLGVFRHIQSNFGWQKQKWDFLRVVVSSSVRWTERIS